MKSKLPLLIRTQTSESHFIECSLNLLLLINSSGNKMKMNNVSINSFVTADCFFLTQCLIIHSWMLFGTCVPLSFFPLLIVVVLFNVYLIDFFEPLFCHFLCLPLLSPFTLFLYHQAINLLRSSCLFLLTI